MRIFIYEMRIFIYEMSIFKYEVLNPYLKLKIS